MHTHGGTARIPVPARTIRRLSVTQGFPPRPDHRFGYLGWRHHTALTKPCQEAAGSRGVPHVCDQAAHRRRGGTRCVSGRLAHNAVQRPDRCHARNVATACAPRRVHRMPP
jgi:hypothetical protein